MVQQSFEHFKKVPALSDYPKQFSTKDGRAVIVRPMVKDDADKLFEFFSGLEKEDKLFLRDDVSRPEVTRRWAENLNYDVVLPLLGIYEDRIIADGTLHSSNYFWTRHVAEIRIVVAKEFRNTGLAKKIVSELFFYALKRGFKKIVAQVPFYQLNTIRIFESLGFEKEAILKKHIMVQGKGYFDLLIMSVFSDSAMHNIRKIS
ncbi:MAG: GNAT family N-acetyltransferase [Candidatus Calescibacterium sp.]|nr:GNAT family N-acetyltransferase [Candidatus Calescibacterium sp.]MCX7733886.1 GNAT family N-acetyltransferase [bacterium]MDW8086667.1 GNAT family protein [Candidatus Calescibacterium sp.]